MTLLGVRSGDLVISVFGIVAEMWPLVVDPIASLPSGGEALDEKGGGKKGLHLPAAVPT